MLKRCALWYSLHSKCKYAQLTTAFKRRLDVEHDVDDILGEQENEARENDEEERRQHSISEESDDDKQDALAEMDEVGSLRYMRKH